MDQEIAEMSRRNEESVQWIRKQQERDRRERLRFPGMGLFDHGLYIRILDELDEADLEAGAHVVTFLIISPSNCLILAELDALELEAEEEGPSYLADLNKAPDFIDEAPVEDVSSFSFVTYISLHIHNISRLLPKKRSKLLSWN